jgi:hypothetical protein
MSAQACLTNSLVKHASISQEMFNPKLHFAMQPVRDADAFAVHSVQQENPKSGVKLLEGQELMRVFQTKG